MARRHSIAEARNNLPTLVREAESGKPVELTRRGERVAVLLSRKEYERLARRSRRFSEAWRDFSSNTDVATAAIDPDEVFAETRDSGTGRKVDW